MEGQAGDELPQHGRRDHGKRFLHPSVTGGLRSVLLGADPDLPIRGGSRR